MSSQLTLSTTTIKSVFEEEITALDGRVLDTFDDRSRLFVRAVLPAVEEVRPHDKLQGGVALRVAHDEIVLCPYVLRQICTNGMVVAQSLQWRRFTLGDVGLVEPFLFELRSAIQSCCLPDEFRSNVERTRTSLTQPISPVLASLTLSARFLLSSPTGWQQAIKQVFAEFVSNSARHPRAA